ncbi:Outer membrane autotransporter (modular protein) [Bradyrhizobium sp. ORS 375]|uniref:autotransporter outer membrane beta-barrel domain-containing protein n=1 Tax=Bradyrhizobium sp. (strain ORS 375) TaxID=566679 RepID=UPI00024059DC|nr:autotransporter domain-containing protein [Bradyrhizobium sp. ORS 375]CCD96611.1 Outer membrane autotransporter (modular protein) [Bradyrhizobium sp. ORS 375]
MLIANRLRSDTTKQPQRARRFWLSATALVSSLLMSNAALAQATSGGSGGSHSSVLTNGGTSSATAPGSDGGNDTTNIGGGGGGAGVTGGFGGSANAGTVVGGGGGSGPGGRGNTGGSGNTSSGGGGGGGGAHGALVTTSTTNAATITGGDGGRGGTTSGNHGGGGGGAAGYGVVIDGNNLTYSNTGTVSGGQGGDGGVSSGLAGYGGNGGDGGYGAFLTGTNVVLTNAGRIAGGDGGGGGEATINSGNSAGGNGGAGGSGVIFAAGGTLVNSGIIAGGNSGGSGPGQSGSGVGQMGLAGDGVRGSNLAIINSGTISGGNDSGGNLFGNAIIFTGGSNVLEIWASSIINGNVVGAGSDTFRLGGTANGTFDVSTIGAGAQYQGFSSFVKTGTSAWTLTGTTTAVTPWAINQGTLAVTSDANLGAASGGLSFGGGTLQVLAGFSSSRNITLNAGGGSFDTNGNNATLSGTISGSGGLTKLGAGILTLSGTTTYAGDTVIGGGTLRTGAAGVLSVASSYMIATGATLDIDGTGQTIGGLSGSGNLQLGSNGSLAIGDNGGATVFSGTISGSGSFVKSGPGVLTLSGTNTYTGATVIDGGTLRAGAAGAFAPLSSVEVDNGGTLDLNGFNQTIASLTGGGAILLGAGTLTSGGDNSSTSYTGTISGSGGFTKVGTGTMRFDGLTSYTGATTISAGTLQAGASGVLASASAFMIASGATLDLNGFNQSIGSLAGNGNVLLGAATLTAGGNNGSTTFAGTISGSGGFTKSGTGRMTLTGTSNYTGATIINGGVLDVAGAITNTSGVTVNAGGTLMGAGLVDPPMTVSINNGGTLAPGNGSAGSSMTIVGNLAFQSGAYYLVQFDPTMASFASVTGSATLGGATVNAVFANGAYVDKRYTILTTGGGVSGSFGTVVKTNLPSGFKTSLSYDANNVYLDLVLAFALPGGLNGNQKAVGDALSAFFDRTGDIPLVFGRLNQAGLTQASGESATGVQQTSFNAMSQFVGLLTDPFAQRQGGGATGHADPARKRTDAFAMLPDERAADFAQRWNAWAAGFGGSQSTSGHVSVGSNDTTSRIAATAVGADYRIAAHTIAGFALAGGGTSFSVNSLGSGRSDLFQAGAYLHHHLGPSYLRAALAYGWQDVTTDRTVAISGTDRLRASYQANAWTGRIEGGTRFVAPLGGIGVTPYAAAQVTSLRLPAYVEQATVGASTFALTYASKTVTDTRTELGLRTDKSYALTDGTLTLRGRIAWAHDFNPDRSVAATFQTLPGASFVVNGAAQARDSALTTTSIEMNWLNGWSALATFESEVSNVTRSYAGKGTVRYAW